MCLLKKLFSMLLALTLLMNLAACQKTDKQPEVGSKETTQAQQETTKKEDVTLKIFTAYVDDDTKIPFDYAKDALEKEMPNVKLELEVEPQDNGTKLKTYAATGVLPDIFRVDIGLITALVKSNQILQLDDYFKKFNVEEKFNETARKYQLRFTDGHIYAIPQNGSDIIVMYYNKELFEKNGVKVPTNYDETLAAVKAFNAKNIIPLSIFAKEKWVGVELFDMMATREEPDGIKKLDQNKAKMSDEAYKKATEKFVSLAKAGMFGKGATNTAYDQAFELFASNKAAMFINGAWAMPDLAKAMGDKVDLLYSPFADAGKEAESNWNMSGGGSPGGFAINSATKNKDIAAEYCIKFVLKYNEARVLKRGQVIQALKNPPTPEIQLFPIQKKFLEDSKNFKSMSVLYWGMTNLKFKAPFEDAVQKLITGSYAADSFIKDMDKALEASEKQ